MEDGVVKKLDQKTIVLVGQTGNGKSAVGNCILGRKAFHSMAGPGLVTRSIELQTVKLPDDGGMLRIIDTPRHLGLSLKSDTMEKEIRECFEMAGDEIHAVILVLSVRSRFTEVDNTVIRALWSIFGSDFDNCMIVVFTGADELERSGLTLSDYFGPDPPRGLQVIRGCCGNRMMTFDSKTLDEKKRIAQLNRLLQLIDMVTEQNNGKPFGKSAFSPLAQHAHPLDDYVMVDTSSSSSWEEETHKFSEELLKRRAEEEPEFVKDMNKFQDELESRMTQELDKKVNELVNKLEKLLQLQVEKRLELEKSIKNAQAAAREDIRNMRGDVDRVIAGIKELRERKEKHRCGFLCWK